MSLVKKKALILLGAPASGKGTQARLIANRYGFRHISTGDMLRENIKQHTTVGLLAESYINKGMLVPDSVIMEIMEERISHDDCNNGILTDGFPRTLNQAIDFDNLANVEKVINISVELDVLKFRICGRRVCQNCNRVFHVSEHTHPICNCGGRLYVRKDDDEETFDVRYRQYIDLTSPLIEYYSKQGKLTEIEGNAPPQVVFERITKILG